MSDDNKIRVRIQRGTSQIGGVCTEVFTNQTRIFFDFGTPLEGEGNQDKLEIEGLTCGTANTDAVFLTHYHGDHVGEVPNIISSIPVYMHKTARKILQAQQEHKVGIGEIVWAKEVKDLEFGESVTIKDLTVTAIESDHSAINSLMYLVEGYGKRVLITGDYRLHGSNSEKLMNTFKELPHIDLMISEGTNLSRESKFYNDEKWVEEEFVKIFKNFEYVFMLSSSSNIERIAAFLRNVEGGKYALVDRYQQNILNIVKEDRKDNLIPDKINYYGTNIDDEMEKKGFRFVIRASEPFESIVKYYCDKYPEKTCFIYSMWGDYINKYPDIKRIVGYCHVKENLKFIHVSGHITKEDLEKVINTIVPDRLIIYHTPGLKEKDRDLKIIPEIERIIAIDGEEIYL